MPKINTFYKENYSCMLPVFYWLKTFYGKIFSSSETKIIREYLTKYRALMQAHEQQNKLLLKDKMAKIELNNGAINSYIAQEYNLKMIRLLEKQKLEINLFNSRFDNIK